MSTSAPTQPVDAASVDSLTPKQLETYARLEEACRAFTVAPIVSRFKLGKDIKDSMEELQSLGAVPRWGRSKDYLIGRRNISN